MYISTGSSFYTGWEMLVDKNGLCSNRSQSGPLPLSLLLCHGAGGTVYCLGIEENKNYYIGIDQSYVYDFFFLLMGINYSKTLIISGKLMDMINWQQLCLLLWQMWKNFAEIDIQFDLLQLVHLFLRSGHYEQPIVANGLTSAGITTIIPLMCRNKMV